jgi:hypothetical protein
MNREQIIKVLKSQMNHVFQEDSIIYETIADRLTEPQVSEGYMAIRSILRSFIRWQLQEDMIDCLTIDYEMAETYLEQSHHPKPISEERIYEVFANHSDFTPYLNFDSFRASLKELGLRYCKYIKREGESCTLNDNCKYPNCPT